MFGIPTIFVLGAGASVECGLPDGQGLKRNIAEILSPGADRQWANNRLRHLVQTRFGQEIATELSAVIPTFPSMDEALHYLGDQPEIVLLGKAAIVDRILIAESISSLATGLDNRAKVNAAAHTWMPRFLSMAFGSLTRSEAENAFRNVTVINFNYDRTLEHYLYAALQVNAALSAERARSVIEHMPVIRPYGSLGGLEWMDDPKISFGDVNVDIISFADGIRTYTQQTQEGLRDQIQAAIEPTKLFIFLGFGFHQQNLALLQNDDGRRSVQRHVFATVRGIDENNWMAISSRLNQTLLSGQIPQLLDMKASELLIKLRPSIMLAR